MKVQLREGVGTAATELVRLEEALKLQRRDVRCLLERSGRAA